MGDARELIGPGSRAQFWGGGTSLGCRVIGGPDPERYENHRSSLARRVLDWAEFVVRLRGCGRATASVTLLVASMVQKRFGESGSSADMDIELSVRFW